MCVVRDVERLLDVHRRAELRETHDLGRLGRGHDDLAVLERERDHHGALLAAREMLACRLDDRGRRFCPLEGREKSLLARPISGALLESRRE